MNLSKNFILNALSSVIASAVPLLLLPVLTHYLSEAEYGILTTLMTIITILAPLMMWGVASALSVEYFKISEADFKSYFSSLICIPLISFAVIFIVTLLISLFVEIEEKVISQKWIVALPFLVFFSLIPQIYSTLLRVKNFVMVAAGIEILAAVLVTSLSLVLVVVFGLHWQGRVIAIGLSSFLISILGIAWFTYQGYFVRSITRSHIIDGIRFGAGLVPHDLGNQAIRAIDRLLIVSMVGLAGAGKYAVAVQVASIMLVILSAFNQAWAPYLFSQLEKGGVRVKRDLVKKSYVIIILALIFFIIFQAVVPWIYNWLIDFKFRSSEKYVFWLGLGYFFTAVYLTYVDYIFYVKKTHILSVITLFNLICNFVLGYFFIGKYGEIGAAYAFSVTMFIVMVLAFVLSNRLYPMPWFFWRMKCRVD